MTGPLTVGAGLARICRSLGMLLCLAQASAAAGDQDALALHQLVLVHVALLHRVQV